MNHFVTLFPNGRNIHLVKAVGQIPLHMQRNFKFRSTFVCHNNGDYSYLDEMAEGLSLHFLDDRGERFFWDKAAVSYIKKYATDIDVLNLTHLTQESMLYGLLYKHFNPEGILYLKLDFDLKDYKHGIQFSERSLKEWVHQRVLPFFLKKLDVASVESSRGMERIEQLDERLYDKTLILKNGIDLKQIRASVGSPAFEQKEDLIITVGRIGTEQKNSELLLEALAGIDFGDWEVKFIGPVQDAFKPEIDRFFKNHPDLKHKITFTGEVLDRSELMNYYKKAKIFCLPSRWESFGIVLTEAQSMGNYIIGTDGITPINETVKDQALGKIVESEDVGQLKNALTDAMQPGFYTEELMDKITEHARQYHWPVLLEPLNSKINNLL